MNMEQALLNMGKVVKYTPRQDLVRIIGVVPKLAKVQINGKDFGTAVMEPEQVVVQYIDEDGEATHATRCYRYNVYDLEEVPDASKMKVMLKNGTRVNVVFESGEYFELMAVNYCIGLDSKICQYCGLINVDNGKSFSKGMLPRSVNLQDIKKIIEITWDYRPTLGRVASIAVED